MHHWLQNCWNLARGMGYGDRRSMTAVLEELYWLPLSWHIEDNVLVLVLRALHNQTPTYRFSLLWSADLYILSDITPLSSHVMHYVCNFIFQFTHSNRFQTSRGILNITQYLVDILNNSCVWGHQLWRTKWQICNFGCNKYIRSLFRKKKFTCRMLTIN